MRKKVTKRQGASKAHSAPFARISADNEIWVAQQIVASGRTLTAVVNRAIECARTGQKFSLEAHEPAYIKKAEAAKRKRLARYEALAKPGSEAHAS